jgi:hypothetical protein
MARKVWKEDFSPSQEKRFKEIEDDGFRIRERRLTDGGEARVFVEDTDGNDYLIPVGRGGRRGNPIEHERTASEPPPRRGLFGRRKGG